MTPGTRQAMKWWEGRRSHGQYMLCYDNGKSAARVVPGLRPKSVHSWELPAPYNTARHCKTTLIDPRNLELRSMYRYSGHDGSLTSREMAS